MENILAYWKFSRFNIFFIATANQDNINNEFVFQFKAKLINFAIIPPQTGHYFHK